MMNAGFPRMVHEVDRSMKYTKLIPLNVLLDHKYELFSKGLVDNDRSIRAFMECFFWIKQTAMLSLHTEVYNTLIS